MDGLKFPEYTDEEIDERTACGAFVVMMNRLEELKTTSVPIPFGKFQYFTSFVPKKQPDDILELGNPYWWGYAETLREYKALLESIPKQAFVDKKKK